MKSADALKLLQKMIEESSGGYCYPDERATIQRLLGAIRSGVVRRYDKFDELEHWVDVYFSERKHQKHEGGLPQIRVWIYTCIDTLEGCID